MSWIAKKKYLKGNDSDIDAEAEPSANINNSKPENKIEKELEAFLKPLHIMDFFFFCSKYKIRKGKIVPNSTIYNVLSFFYTFLLMVACGYFIFASPFKIHIEGYQYFLQWSRVIFYFFLFTSTFLNCFINIFRSNRIVLFILKMQNVYKILKMTEDIKSLVFSNWCHVVILHVYHVVWVSYAYFYYSALGAGNNITSYCWAAVDTNLLYAIQTVKLLIVPLQNWVRKIKLTRCDEEESWTSMLVVYKDFLEAYEIFEETFQFSIVFYAILTTSKYVLSLVIRIELWKVSFENRSTTEYLIFSFISFTWIFKNLTLFILLSIECERLYSAMEEIQSTCKQFINWNQYSENQKRVCKNIQRLHRTNFKKMCVCGVFYIDAAMSIQLSSIISTYTIVILQFEFL